ncbi:hypothetical protein BFJ70_g16283 [Fusarium oxysporum]|uniref:Uncharacterized protein n=2 Tax=Fusarium oxysporum TaxID=5507 RepID=A0A420R5L4_FUSOX|nr:hypothetical protein HZS61_008951 [Fusarium oxysporum f. sp. conglutinans]KAH7190419.1 hypothetical protein DER44DRAFT_112866 [Fusarium oxysporum]KAG6990750.1 hypothetical protein FocnCong_v019765 [Fusarium oxysporum f. sp. conglutinans]KAI8415998.1 hypothetical protein FOFC_02306 [Fusarium oxysporum]RKK58972.1 hypothetical protein BFJ69_g17349 [Fusarium oxysporum]
MPPIRTVKNNKNNAFPGAQAPTNNRPKRTLHPKGVKDAHFRSSDRDWDGKYEQVIGTSTRNIVFGSEFLLTDDHIDDILALGSPVCEKIVQFIFEYEDVGYGARNNAESLTNEAVVRLGKSCPNLKKVQLQATCRVTDDGLLSFFENCPNLTSVELTGTSRGSRDKLFGQALDQLREHQEWAPKLKKLILGEDERNKLFMNAMRSLTKERPGLTVTLLQRHEVKKWGDWELEETKMVYKKGRLAW